MVLWFAGMAFLAVWQVFRDPALDHRLVVVGAVLPEVLDGVRGGARELHTLAASVAVLGLVMLATRGRRAARRQWLALPIGMFLHLVFDAIWARPDVFGWPFFGWSLSGEGLPSLERPVALVAAQEVAGGLALVWVWRRFRLFEPARRSVFLRSGRLGRDLVEPSP